MDRQNTLEKAAIRVMVAFQPQEIANILHIMATTIYKTCLLPELERRAEAISGEFNSQAAANTLWAYATMGTKPGDRMMGQLERRTETTSGKLNSQTVANTLAAYATMGTKPGERVMGQLECRAEAMSWGVELAEHCKHTVQLVGHCKHGVVNMCCEPAESESYTVMHGSVGGGRVSMPQV